jgi:hypothetical protein
MRYEDNESTISNKTQQNVSRESFNECWNLLNALDANTTNTINLTLQFQHWRYTNKTIILKKTQTLHQSITLHLK